MYRDRPELDFDPDAISALTDKRQAQWSKVQNANFLTRNEKREAAGYGPVPGGDEADDYDDGTKRAARPKFNPYHDDLGRFTFGPGEDDDGDDDTSSDQPQSSPSGSDSGPGIFGLPENIEHPATATPANAGPADNNSFDADKAVDTLNQNVDELKRQQIEDGQPNLYGEHACAQYVRGALNDGGGLNVGTPANGLGNAADYGPPLENAGFQPVANGNAYPPEDYTPQAGDVAVIQPTNENASGHMEMYNGSQWVSDFRQDGFWPGPHYRNETPHFVIYRYPNSSINI
jgi:hypothetical protein